MDKPEKQTDEEERSTDETLDVEATTPFEEIAAEPIETTGILDETKLEDVPSVEPEPTVVQVVAPPVPLVTVAQPENDKDQNSPITLVLQWLTYAFWGWFALSLAWLSSVVFSFLVVGAGSADWSSVIAYPVAAVIVLFLVAAVVDFFYARHESTKKQGFAMAIMVIHAVIFALFGISAVIAVVFTAVNLMLGTGESKATLAALYVAILLFVVYLLLIARTTLVAKIQRVSWIVTGVLGVFAVVFIILGVVGPVAQSLGTKQDRDLEAALPEVPPAIDTYVQEHKELPKDLSQLTFSNAYGLTAADTTKATVAKGIISYTANTKEPSQNGGSVYYTTQAEDVKSDSIKGSENIRDNGEVWFHYYRLCVTWQAEKNYGDGSKPVPLDYSTGSTGSSTSGVSVDDTLYTSYMTTYTHKKGEQCYDLSSTSY